MAETVAARPAVAEEVHSSVTGDSVIKEGYDPRFTNAGLAPLKSKRWTWYNYLAFWLTDVQGIGGYVFAGSLFALGISAWQVLVSLFVGISVVLVLCNLVARPSQEAGVPYPAIARVGFGVRGANVAAGVRALNAVAWYGIQTYLASSAIVLLALRLVPALRKFADVDQYGFLGLSAVGWGGFMVMWIAQAIVFWNGIEAIRRFIDFCGPSVYVMMIVLAGYLIARAGWDNVSFGLSGGANLSGWSAIAAMISAVALVVSYFIGPTLNFGDFSRYGKTFKQVKIGNFLGLPVNFLLFALLVVCSISAAATVVGRDEAGQIITDPIQILDRVDNTTIAVLGLLTFAMATVGINIIAAFVAAAFDFSNMAPRKISWRAGGAIAALGSVIVTPWNLYHSPQAIHYTLDTLGALLGPILGVILADYYLVKKARVKVDDLFTIEHGSSYRYRNGVNPVAIGATGVAAVVGICVVLFGSSYEATFTWFIGAACSFILYWLGMTYLPRSLVYGTDDRSGDARDAHRGRSHADGGSCE